jgi:hypothetical protein
MTESTSQPMRSLPLGRRVMPAPGAVIDGFDLVFTVRSYDVVLFDDPPRIRLTLIELIGVRVPVGRRQPRPAVGIGVAGLCNPLRGRHEDSCR